MYCIAVSFMSFRFVDVRLCERHTVCHDYRGDWSLHRLLKPLPFRSIGSDGERVSVAGVQKLPYGCSDTPPLESSSRRAGPGHRYTHTLVRRPCSGMSRKHVAVWYLHVGMVAARRRGMTTLSDHREER